MYRRHENKILFECFEVFQYFRNHFKVIHLFYIQFDFESQSNNICWTTILIKRKMSLQEVSFKKWIKLNFLIFFFHKIFLNCFFFIFFLLKQFDQAVEDVKNLKTSPSNDDLLEIYALYKQATVGNVNTSKLIWKKRWKTLI